MMGLSRFRGLMPWSCCPTGLMLCPLRRVRSRITRLGIDPHQLTHLRQRLTGAERALRFCVIDRRITQGTRGRKGQQWCERFWTIQATCRQQGRRICQFIQQAVYDSFEGNLPTGLITA